VPELDLTGSILSALYTIQAPRSEERILFNPAGMTMLPIRSRTPMAGTNQKLKKNRKSTIGKIDRSGRKDFIDRYCDIISIRCGV
jgi:hypothetical protein